MPPVLGHPADAVWNPDTEMEPAAEPPAAEKTQNEPKMTWNEPETTWNVPETTQNEPTEMDTNTDNTAAEMCPLQMKAIPIRVGAKTPANIHKAGVPMELYTLAAFTVLPLGAAREALGLHIVLPASTEIVLQFWANFQRLGLTVTNPELGPSWELTAIPSNACPL